MAGIAPVVGKAMDEGVHVDGWMQGALIELSREEYEKLWLSEAGGMGDRSPYCETVVECVVDSTKERRKAIAFRTRESQRLTTHDIPPSSRYLNVIYRGAEKLGVDPRYLEAIRSVPTAKPCGPVARSMCRLGLVVLVLAAWNGVGFGMISRLIRLTYFLNYSRELHMSAGHRKAALLYEMLLICALLPIAAIGYFLIVSCSILGWLGLDTHHATLARNFFRPASS